MILRRLFGKTKTAPFRQSVEVFEFEGKIFLCPVVRITNSKKRGDPSVGLIVRLTDRLGYLGESLAKVLANSRMDKKYRPERIEPEKQIEKRVLEELGFQGGGNPFDAIRYAQAIRYDSEVVLYPSIKGALDSRLGVLRADLENSEECGKAMLAAIEECRIN